MSTLPWGKSAESNFPQTLSIGSRLNEKHCSSGGNSHSKSEAIDFQQQKKSFAIGHEGSIFFWTAHCPHK